MRTLTAGGLFGMGPGGGTRKFGLPEPHTDYIFSVIGEEFGLIACLAIALPLPGDRRAGADEAARRGIDLRHPRRRRPRRSPFGLQALINMAVNVQIAPSKGMTLPFICYGGSSMLALSHRHGIAARLHPPKPVSRRARLTS